MAAFRRHSRSLPGTGGSLVHLPFSTEKSKQIQEHALGVLIFAGNRLHVGLDLHPFLPRTQVLLGIFDDLHGNLQLKLL